MHAHVRVGDLHHKCGVSLHGDEIYCPKGACHHQCPTTRNNRTYICVGRDLHPIRSIVRIREAHMSAVGTHCNLKHCVTPPPMSSPRHAVLSTVGALEFRPGKRGRSPRRFFPLFPRRTVSRGGINASMSRAARDKASSETPAGRHLHHDTTASRILSSRTE